MGYISGRVGDWARLETPLLSPFILSNFRRTRVGMSNRSEGCRACLLAPRMGDGLRLRARDAEDMAKDGTFRRANGDFKDGDFVSGKPYDTCGESGAPSMECRP